MENIENAKALLSYSNTISKAQKSKVFAFSYIDNINIDKSITHLYTLKPNINKDSSVVKYHSTATIPHKKLTFRIYVEGLIYAAKLPQVYFENIVDGYILSKNIIANTSRHIKFIPDEIYIEKNNISNGTVSRTLNVFDITDKNGKNLIKLDFTLKDGSTHHIEMDASKHIQREDKEIYIEISIKLPKVEIDNDMPFKPDIDDWKDIEIDTPV